MSNNDCMITQTILSALRDCKDFNAMNRELLKHGYSVVKTKTNLDYNDPKNNGEENV